jgi:hypothetical protein
LSHFSWLFSNEVFTLNVIILTKQLQKLESSSISYN